MLSWGFLIGLAVLLGAVVLKFNNVASGLKNYKLYESVSVFLVGCFGFLLVVMTSLSAVGDYNAGLVSVGELNFFWLGAGLGSFVFLILFFLMLIEGFLYLGLVSGFVGRGRFKWDKK